MLRRAGSPKRIIRRLLPSKAKALRAKRARRPGLGGHHAAAKTGGSGALRRAGELAGEEGVAGGVLGQAGEVGAGGVDEGAGGGVLRGDAQVADVAERVLALARRQQRVEPRHVRILRLGRLGPRLRLRLRLRLRRLVLRDGVEGARCSLLLERVERGLEPRLGARRPLEGGREGVVRACGLRFDVLRLE